MQRTNPVVPEKKSRKRKHEDDVAKEAIDAIEAIGEAAIEAIEDIEVAEEEKAEKKGKPTRKKKHEEEKVDVEALSSDGASEEEEEPPRKKRRIDPEAEAEEKAFLERAMLDALMAPPQPIMKKGFTSADTDKLSENEYFRYEVPYRKPGSPPKKVAHAVIVGDTALQFAIPPGEKEETPIIRPLEDIEEFTDYGAPRLRAHTPDGTQMFASRFVDGEFDGEPWRLACFSPPPFNKEKPFWGSEKEVPLLDKNMREKKKKEVQKDLAEIFAANKKANLERLGREDTSLIKGGTELVIDPGSVQIRDGIKTRIPDQNTVMGESAKEAYEGFLEKYEDILSDEMIRVIARAKDAHLKHEKGDKPEQSGQYRPEWGHLEGFSLTPRDKNPQKKDNLGAMPKWANTEMMIAERTIKWTALNRPEAVEKIKAEFKMLLDSELVDKIDYVATIEENDHTLAIHQKINPLKQWPLFPQPTDTMQTIAVSHFMLDDAPLASKSDIKRAGKVKKMKAATPAEGLAARPVGDVEFEAPPEKMEIDEEKSAAEESVIEEPVIEKPKPVIPKPIVKKPIEKPIAEKGDEAMRPREKKRPEAEKPVARAKQQAHAHGSEEISAFPTHASWEKSVVRINTTAKEWDFSEPWVGSKQKTWRGSGFVIEHEGKKYIVTNAHVAGGAVNMTVKFANGKTKYQAKIRQIARHCDLAMLTVDDPEFQEQAVPVEVGEMPSLTQKVQVVGFPMGGDEVYTSIGIVSRIEVGDYCESELSMLHVGVDAAINGGNSGGPVFAHGKVAGVAFQGWPLQGLGYMIPPPIISHFITEVLSGKRYRGFPILPVVFEPIGNKLLRKYYGMQPEQTGVMIHKVDKCCDAFDKLKKNDIVLEIDGMAVSNDGKIDIPGVGNNIDMIHATHRKFIGDSVKLKVLRKNEATRQVETLEVSVLLDRVPGETKKVAQLENHLPPSYFVCSGFSFTPVTEGYLNQRGADLTEKDDLMTHEGIADLTKDQLDEQVIVVNDVLACAATEEYEDLINEIVKKINGKDIKNIRDVVRAMEEHTGDEHVIEFGDGRLAVVPRMSKEENDKLLEEYDIKADRSKDLRKPVIVDAMDIDEQPAAPAQAKTKPALKVVLPEPTPAPTIVKPAPVRATPSTAKILKAVAAPKPVEVSSEEELMPDWEGSEDAAPSAKKERQPTIDDLPGVKRFRNAVDQIEAEAKLRGELGIDDEEIALEDLGEGDSEESSEESTVELQPQRRQPSVGRHHATAFAKRKRDASEDEEEQQRDRKHFKK